MKAFNCKTLEDAQDFIYECIKRDIQVWRCACWDVYKENTCYHIENNKVMYSSVNYYTREEYEIITYEKGDSIFGEKFEHLKGEGQCCCAICGTIGWTSFCYRLFDKSSKYHKNVICGNCKRRIESDEKI